MQLVVQYFIILIILWYHNMVGNCKLIIKTLNLIDIRILYSLFRKFEIFFHMFEYYWNSNILLVFNTRILIQILNQKPRIVYIQKIFRIIITILSTENRILTLIPRWLSIARPFSTFSIDTRQQPIFSPPFPDRSISPRPSIFTDSDLLSRRRFHLFSSPLLLLLLTRTGHY